MVHLKEPGHNYEDVMCMDGELGLSLGDRCISFHSVPVLPLPILLAINVIFLI